MKQKKKDNNYFANQKSLENKDIFDKNLNEYFNICIPDIGENEVEVTEIMVKVGENIHIEQSIITVEGDKVSMEIPTPVAGVIKEIKVNIGDKVKTGTLIMICEVKKNLPSKNIIEDKDKSLLSLKKNNSKINNDIIPIINKENEKNIYIHATPSIRRLARKLNIKLEKIQGTGRKKRILYEDIQNFIKNKDPNFENLSLIDKNQYLSELISFNKIDFSKFGDIEEIELTSNHKICGKNLHRNWIMIPHVTQFDEIDITELEIFRKKQNIEYEKEKLNIKITPLVFIIKAIAKALVKFPYFNSSISENSKKLILKKYINIGIAVDTLNGLLVPVLNNVNEKGIKKISIELINISKKARSGKLTLKDMEGGCFTISSLGGIGGKMFTPIINAPEVAILGVSKSSIKPIWNGKEFIPRTILPISLSYDHRVINGADGARFIIFINKIVSDIRHLLM